MVDIRVDTSDLPYTRFLIPEHSSGYIDGAEEPSLSVTPGDYSLQMTSGLLGSFRFTVSSDGLLDYPDTCDAFLEGGGTSTYSGHWLRRSGDPATTTGGSLSSPTGPRASADVIILGREADLAWQG
jgi:hypothetical protein